MAGTNNIILENEILSYSDEVATEDQLGLSNYIQGVARFISECSTPMTMSIQGDWGSGKTSFFNLIERELTGEDSEFRSNIIDVVTVNTWQFSVAGAQDCLVPLVFEEILDSILGTDDNDIQL